MTKKEWEEWKDENREDFNALKELAEENGDYDLFSDLITTDEVDDFVRDRLDNSGWQGVACCISDIIDNMNEDFYEIDGYGNLTTISDWDSYADDLEYNLEFDDCFICDYCKENVDCVYDVDEWIDEEDIEDEELIDIIEKMDEKLNRDYCEVCWENLLLRAKIFLNCYRLKIGDIKGNEYKDIDSFLSEHNLYSSNEALKRLLKYIEKNKSLIPICDIWKAEI